MMMPPSGPEQNFGSHFSSFTTIFDTLAETGISFDSETSQEFKNINQGSRAKVKQLCQKSDNR